MPGVGINRQGSRPALDQASAFGHMQAQKSAPPSPNPALTTVRWILGVRRPTPPPRNPGASHWARPPRQPAGLGLSKHPIDQMSPRPTPKRALHTNPAIKSTAVYGRAHPWPTYGLPASWVLERPCGSYRTNRRKKRMEKTAPKRFQKMCREPSPGLEAPADVARGQARAARLVHLCAVSSWKKAVRRQLNA
jgi:hypothetical protein